MTVLSALKPYPSWLCEHLWQGTLPWKTGRALTYGQFSQQYTLRDSRWLGIFQQQHQAIACILWDSLWLPDALFAQIAPGEQVYLCLRCDRLLGIAVDQAADPAASSPAVQERTAITWANGTAVAALDPAPAQVQFDRDSAVIDQIELEQVEGHSVLLISDTWGNSTTAVFQGELHFLAIASSRALTL